jgi:Pretoxin HINT domain
MGAFAYWLLIDTPIAQIKIGDFVLAWDEKTSEISFHPVTNTIHHTDKTIVHLIIGGEEITTTLEHPFYVEGKINSTRKVGLYKAMERSKSFR